MLINDSNKVRKVKSVSENEKKLIKKRIKKLVKNLIKRLKKLRKKRK